MNINNQLKKYLIFIFIADFKNKIWKKKILIKKCLLNIPAYFNQSHNKENKII